MFDSVKRFLWLHLLGFEDFNMELVNALQNKITHTYRLAVGGYIVTYYTSQDNMKWKYQLSRLKQMAEKNSTWAENT